ncbi:restriction endonuclease subunit S [Pseudoalteromonas sp. SWYJZ98]|uniref:restriction endonuclease subunit S n=1 Tax=Pseudoalteromonas sp. SWYJZ98 TaxID=2792060 RepID=UPI0018CE35B8|nr:restriction endonuclease subunit S [Pseudoalteromonas sp. SWYJZ98]MBH0031961.1 restriction endonuclease subunit S [Pseudoalteromonas sp. SWYJZ98]
MTQQEEIKLPKGWVEAPLEEIAKWGAGGTPKRSETSYYGGDIPWVKTGDLGPRRLKVASEHITELGVKNSSAKLFTKGSVAIAMYGATIGKTSILDFDATTNQACAVGQPIADVTDTEFLYYILKNEKQNFIDKGKGGAQPNISQQIIKAHTIGFPPHPEQKRIVEKLDSVLAQVDTIQQRLNNLPDIIKRFRQSVLAAAVSGKLTEQWRDSSDIAQWKQVKLGDVGKGFNYGSSTKSEKEGRVPVLRMGNIQSGKLDWEKLVYTSDPDEIKKYKLNKYDVVFNRTNSPELVGKTAIYLGEKESIFAGYLIRVQGSERLDALFLNFLLNSPKARAYCREVKTDGVSQSNINAQKLKALEFNLPPMTEQTEIVRLVEQYFALADTLEKNLANAKQRVDNLTQSILAKAFRGELVPQDPNDEPADKLLARIKAARLEAEKLEKAAKKAAKASKK